MQRMESDEGSPDLEMVRPDQNQGCTSSLPSSPPRIDKDDVTSLSIFDLEDRVKRYYLHLKNFNMKDKNEKLRHCLHQYENELARRRSPKETGNRVIQVDAAEQSYSKPTSAKKQFEVFDIENDMSISGRQLPRPSPEKCYPTIALDRVTEDGVPFPVHNKEKEVDEIQDLDESPRSVNAKVCSGCLQAVTSKSNEVDGCFRCSSCKKTLISSLANGITPVNSTVSEKQFLTYRLQCIFVLLHYQLFIVQVFIILQRNNLFGFTRLNESSGSAKRSQQAIGDTFDTALELSDDEESKEMFPGESSGGCKLLKRKCLRNASEKVAVAKFLYPSSCDVEAVEVRYADLCHLAPTEFLNDTVIDFYMKYMQMNLLDENDRLHRFYFFSCFFYKKLTSSKAQGKDWFEKLHKWTKGINIFEKEYLFIPIHDRCHWSLAIVCFPVGQRVPLILHLDSMSATAGHSSQVIFNVLKSYLTAERKHLRQQHDSMADIIIEPFKAICRRKQVPLQDNEWDCGLFMLYYMQKFVTEVDAKGLDKLFGRDWFKPSEASDLRGTILNILESMFTEKDTQM